MSEYIKKHTHHFHYRNLMQCSSIDCVSNDIPLFFCKICALSNKEETDHVIEHYEYITQLKQEPEYQKILSDDQYKYGGITDCINRLYELYYKRIKIVPNRILENFLECGCIIKKSIKREFQKAYCNLILDIQNSCRALNKKLEKNMIEVGERPILIKLNRDMEIYSNELQCPVQIKSELDSIIEKSRSYLIKLSVKEYEKSNFCFRLHNYRLLWENGSNIINTCNAKDFTIKLKDYITGAFKCIIKVITLNIKNPNLSIGLLPIQGIHKTKEKPHFLVNNHGYLKILNQSKKVMKSKWKEGDILTLERDKCNSVYFTINNDEITKQCLSKYLRGRVYVCMTFTNVAESENSFEIIYLGFI